MLFPAFITRQRFLCKHDYVSDTSLAGLTIPSPSSPGSDGGPVYPWPPQESINREMRTRAHTHTHRTFNAAKPLSSKDCRSIFPVSRSLLAPWRQPAAAGCLSPVTSLLPPPTPSGTHGGQEGPPLPMRLRTGMRACAPECAPLRFPLPSTTLAGVFQLGQGPPPGVRA